MGIFGFKLNPQMALVMFLAGLGIMFYGLFVSIINYELMLVPESWLDWTFTSYIILHFLAIGMGAYLSIAGFLSRKSHK